MKCIQKLHTKMLPRFFKSPKTFAKILIIDKINLCPKNGKTVRKISCECLETPEGPRIHPHTQIICALYQQIPILLVNYVQSLFKRSTHHSTNSNFLQKNNFYKIKQNNLKWALICRLIFWFISFCYHFSLSLSQTLFKEILFWPANWRILF